MNVFLEQILKECYPFTKNGAVASYIPELAKADPTKLGICLFTNERQTYFAGDHSESFTMQSVVKPVILLSALMNEGEECVRDLVGVEATGKPFDAFNYSDQALRGAHINPMINTGAIALCTLMKGTTYAEKFSALLELTRRLASNPTLTVDEDVYRSEKATGNKNRALAYMLKAYGMIDDDVEELIDCYFRACSIKVDCTDLAKIASVFANHGVDITTGERFFEEKYAKFVNAILTTCGMYDGSGEFALNVGVPAKSGVGGGIMAIVPNRMGIGIFSPVLDKKGNSIAGIKALEMISRQLNLSIF